MNLNLYTLLFKLVLLALLALAFFFEYKTAEQRKQMIATLTKVITAHESTIGSLKRGMEAQARTIAAQEKNIAIRKEKMGY
ncbi:MAG: hypothetical protein DME26_19375 [Verrucomicrobia bacterium]|nr:MAG: hypothetical protein DME26_19375 [Verrucomicrobiota bacterium]